MEHWYLRNSYVVHVPTLDRTWSDENEFGIHVLPAEMHRNFTSLATFKTLLKQYYRNALNLCYDPEDARTWKSVCVSAILPATS